MSIHPHDQVGRPAFRHMLLILGLLLLVFNLFNKSGKFYLGEKLSEKQVTIKEAPKLIENEKGNDDRFTLTTEEYKCRFWIVKGALDIIRDQPELIKEINSLKKGDIANIKFRETAQSSLQKASGRVRILEISSNNKTLLNAADVEAKDKKWYYGQWIAGILLVVIWLALQLKANAVSKKALK